MKFTEIPGYGSNAVDAESKEDFVFILLEFIERLTTGIEFTSAEWVPGSSTQPERLRFDIEQA